MKKILSFFAAIFLAGTFQAKTVCTVDPDSWTAWGNDIPVKITVTGKETSFEREIGGGGWNTPIYKFKEHPVVNAFLFLKFEYLCVKSGKFEVNLGNKTEEAEYSVPIILEAGQWKEVSVHINSANYKRFGKPGITPDGMAGDRLDTIQIAYSGKKITLRNVVLEEVSPDDPSLFARSNPAVEIYVKERKVPDYRQFKRNSIFPFGVISTIRAGDMINGQFFGQSTLERLEDSLRLARLTGFNAYSNFCDSSGLTIPERLDLMQKYDMGLMETSTCSTGLANLPDSHPLMKQIAESAHHPNLLAWYGQDEPTDAALYLANKKRIEQLSKDGAPVTSAMHMMSVAKELGPAMDVIILDPYSMVMSVKDSEAKNILEKHAVLVKMARSYCAGKHVWMVLQAFSLRLNGESSLRYPSAAEVSYDVFNTLSAGVNGYFFFIMLDTIPYLKADSRKGESFDQTLYDAWGNATLITEALGAIGKRLTVIMPSFLTRRPLEEIRKISKPDFLEISPWEIPDGILFIAVNGNLAENNSGNFHVELKPGEKLYDLDSLAENSGTFNLTPGNGALYLVATPENFSEVKQSILDRRAKEEAIRQALERAEPAELASVRKAFERMNVRMLSKLSSFDGNPEMNSLREKIKALSKEYFDARREWYEKGTKAPWLSALPAKVDLLHP